ncbi:MAG: FAD-binding protein [Acidimicrobiales bacterium]
MRAAIDGHMAAFASAVGGTAPVAVEGSRSRWHVGGELAAGTNLVKAPEGILEHRPEEMTVRARAGTSVAELHAELASRGQRTALARRGGTIGGALAVGENDLSVLGRGRVRDCVLQLRYVSADGAVVKCGGPTVKNVSGFDLPRLIVGSLGTLGLIGEVILRTNPIPPISRWVESSDSDPFTVLGAVARPSAVLWDGARTFVELEGYPEDVRAEQNALASIGHWAEAAGPPELPAYRWSLRPSDLRHLDNYAIGSFVASVGTGTIFASIPQPHRASSPAVVALAKRVKHQFDPTNRLNPGRSAMRSC